MKKKPKTSKVPPKGWPNEEEWKNIEKNFKEESVYQILSPRASPVDKIKYKLCEEFVKYCNEQELNQRELATKLGASEARVSEIVHYKYQRFTIDKLITLLSIIKPNLKFKVA